jgi:aspartyl aminopeptidase
MYVLDAGIPVLSMHSPMELVSKADVYEAYLAYKAFLAA